MRAHIVENWVIVNTIVVESLDALPGLALIDADLGGSIGWGWDGETLTEPEPDPVPVPSSVTMRQARLALLQSGLLAQVEVVINALPEPDKSAAKIEWDYSSEVWRDKPFVIQLGTALGLDDAELDTLFIEAEKL